MAPSRVDANNVEPPPTKRTRFQEEDTVACLDMLNDNCLVHALSFNSVDDLNSFALCSKRCQEARAHKSLNQARTGIIAISQGCTFESLGEAIVQGNWNEDFQGNQTHAIIDRVERLDGNARFILNSRGRIFRRIQLSGATTIPRRFQLSQVTKLNLKSSPDAGFHYVNEDLPLLFPNLQQVDCSSLTIINAQEFCRSLCQNCPNLNKFTWTGHNSVSFVSSVSGFAFHDARQLTELNLDERTLLVGNSGYTGILSDSSNNGHYLFINCRHLERLSIKNTTWKYAYQNAPSDAFSQEMLVKMVRRHPTLCWLRSDLSEANINMLQHERPKITFVSH